MRCSEFLERHTDFRDGLITSARDSRRFGSHVAHCAACRRYDATVRQGVEVLTSAVPIALSSDFRQRLDARLARERDIIPPTPAHARAAAALLVLAALCSLSK
jgi:anti-sigma factor RsiW